MKELKLTIDKTIAEQIKAGKPHVKESAKKELVIPLAKVIECGVMGTQSRQYLFGQMITGIYYRVGNAEDQLLKNLVALKEQDISDLQRETQQQYGNENLHNACYLGAALDMLKYVYKQSYKSEWTPPQKRGTGDDDKKAAGNIDWSKM